MDIHVTARHFKAHETLRMYATETVKKLERFYNGILSADVILSFEKKQNSVKAAEVHVKVFGTVIKALEKTDDFNKSIDAAVEKAERQLQKYKSKHHEKAKDTLRKVKEKE
jgi:ribosomal subunit interface protein